MLGRPARDQAAGHRRDQVDAEQAGVAGEQRRAQLAGRVGRAAGAGSEHGALQGEQPADHPRDQPAGAAAHPAHRAHDHQQGHRLRGRDGGPGPSGCRLYDRPPHRRPGHRRSPEQPGERGRTERAGGLGGEIGQHPPARDGPGGEQAEGDRRIHVGAAVAPRPGPGEHDDDQADHDRHDGHPHPQLGHCAAGRHASHPPPDQAEHGGHERCGEAELGDCGPGVRSGRPQRGPFDDLHGASITPRSRGEQGPLSCRTGPPGNRRPAVPESGLWSRGRGDHGT